MTGLLKIKTTKEFGESTVSKILDLVENASSKNLVRKLLFRALREFIRQPYVIVLWPCSCFHLYLI